MQQGPDKVFARTFMDEVHRSMIEILGIPENDRNVRLMFYDPDLFDAKPPYQYFIEITMFAGRNDEAKSRLYKTITVKLNTKLGIDPHSVFIVVHEQPLQNWGVRGGISAKDIKFDFNINV